MDPRGFEPLTSSMRTRRATNCAKGPCCGDYVTRALRPRPFDMEVGGCAAREPIRSRRTIHRVNLADDARDWALAAAGESEAFARVFDRHRARVFRHCLRLVAVPADTDDAVAITFLEAWRKRDSVRLVDGSMLPWLLATATHVSHNLRRGARRYRGLLEKLPPGTPTRDHAEHFDDGDAQEALRRLPPLDQQVITLCVLEGLSEKETALVLRVPLGTVKSRLSRAKARLAEQVRITTPRKASHEQ